jgi:aerobic carbon-monoxide dehydrogenase large subunit
MRTGRLFAGDMREHGQLHAAFVRSPHARAHIRAIDIAAALDLPGTIAVWSGRDLAAAGVGPLEASPFRSDSSDRGRQLGLALDEAVYEGQPVAVVVADTPDRAELAAEAVAVTWEEIEPALTLEQADAPGTPAIAGGSDNLAVEVRYGDESAVGREIENAAVTVRLAFRHPRHHPISLEPHACIADCDATGRLTVHLSNESPHLAHRLWSRMLNLPENRLRVVARRVGGGFGSRRVVPIEEAVVAWAAMRLGRPVKWVSERAEAFLTEAHGPDAESVATMAFDETGAITALEVRCRFNVGACFSTFGADFGQRLVDNLAASYRIPVIFCEARGFFTNTTPTDVIDEDGAAAGILVVERLIDEGARSLGMDPATLRQRNRVPEGERATPPGADISGSASTLERVLERVEYGALRDRFATAGAPGRYIGIGISCYSEPPGDAHFIPPMGRVLPLESGLIRVHADGTVSVFAGRASRGDGSERTISRLVAEQLGAPESDIVVVFGDTDASPYEALFPATGSLSAIEGCARSLRHALEQGRSAATDLPEIPQIEATLTRPAGRVRRRSGSHVAVVEIEAETGRVELKRYFAVDEIGLHDDVAEVDVVIRGSLMRGISRALWEQARYRSTGGLGSVSMMTYPVLAATRAPEIETEQVRTRTAERAGVDPGGMAAAAAIANAVVDALSPLGIRHLDMPYTPAKIWEAIRRANQGAG